jgi:tRNA threonylcarbamoyl adenosine modification protein YeaZ
LRLVIDTSSACSALALVGPDGEVVHEEVDDSGPEFDLPARYRRIVQGRGITGVAVATGPGSFTGLRVGVSFGLGLAIGLKVPIFPLSTLSLQAARSDGPVLAVAEAGRGRVYHLAPGGLAGISEPADLPRDWPVVGWLLPNTAGSLETAGLRLKDDGELRSFGAAAAHVLESAREVAYSSLKLEYMQSFSARTL